MNKKPLISIIVPVFNVSKYLNKCLDSLVAISYQHKEIILIDDCSTDRSRDICETYVKKNHNMKLFVHDYNKGVQEARITGICNSKGDYLMFVDSDDYVYESILDDMIMVADKYDADMVACGILINRGLSFYEDIRNRSSVYDKKQLSSWLSDNLFYDFEIQNHKMLPYTQGKLWKRENLLESFIQGRSLRYGEDMITVMHYLIHNVKSLVLIEKPLYVYVKHEGQQTAKTKMELIPFYIDYWEKLDSLNISEISNQITGLIFRDIKPSLYDMRIKNGILGKKYIHAFKTVRNNSSAIKYLFDNQNLPPCIRRHPHFILLKHRFYWLDYMLYYLLWLIPRK